MVNKMSYNKSNSKQNEGINGLLTNKNTYLFLFSSIIIFSFLVWIFLLIKEGKDSIQFNLF